MEALQSKIWNVILEISSVELCLSQNLLCQCEVGLNVWRHHFPLLLQYHVSKAVLLKIVSERGPNVQLHHAVVYDFFNLEKQLSGHCCAALTGSRWATSKGMSAVFLTGNVNGDLQFIFYPVIILQIIFVTISG